MNKYEIVKFNNDSVEVDVTVSPLEETVWLTQEQMALLFNVNVPAINKHIRNIIFENELEESSTISKMEIVRYEGNRRIKRNINIYNLDMIISVGYRVNSVEGIKFRKWANKVLKEYLLQGYVISKERSLVTNENYVRLINKVKSLDERYTTNVHDRYIIIDQNKIYHLGHSIKVYCKNLCISKKIFSISESDSNLISKLLSNI